MCQAGSQPMPTSFLWSAEINENQQNNPEDWDIWDHHIQEKQASEPFFRDTKSKLPKSNWKEILM